MEEKKLNHVTKTIKSKIFLILTIVMSVIAMVAGFGCIGVGLQNNTLKSENMELGKQNSSLSEQNNNLNNQLNDLNNQVSDLNNSIGDLQDTIDYFEYQVALVTFEVNGKVEKVEVVNKNQYYRMPSCSDTTTHVFKGWQINGEGYTYSAYEQKMIIESLKFVAEMEPKVVVSFVVNGNVDDIEYVQKGNGISLPTLSDTDTHYFNGWRIDGVGEVYKNMYYGVEHDLTFVAEFCENPYVILEVNGKIIQNKQVKYDSYFTLPLQEDTDTQYFTGWKVNGVGELYLHNNQYHVTKSVKFVAVMQDFLSVTFMNNGNVLETESKLRYNTSITLPILDDTDTHYFNGWQIDGNGKVFTGSYNVTENVMFVSDIRENDIVLTSSSLLYVGSKLNSSSIWSDGKNVYYSQESEHYILKDNNTWESITWNGLTSFDALDVWTDGENYYYSCYDSSHYEDHQYILKENNTWEPMTWNGLTKFYGRYIWTYDGKCYYSYGDIQFVLENNQWKPMAWKGVEFLTYFDGNNVWTDGGICYLNAYNTSYRLNENKIWEKVEFTFAPNGNKERFYGASTWTDGQNTYLSNGSEEYILTENNVWEPIVFNGGYLRRGGVWTDGKNYYSSYYNSASHQAEQLILDVETRTWTRIEWYGLEVVVNDAYLWSDGENTYYSLGTNQYVVKNNVWEPMTWYGLNDFSGLGVWTDGVRFYYSKEGSNSKHYVLDLETKTWNEIMWNGYSEIRPDFIWTDGKNTYFSNNNKQYVLKSGNTWELITWNVASFNGPDIWTDGKNTYLSTYSEHYVLTNNTWELITWNGVTNFRGSNVWTDGQDFYLGADYVLDLETKTWLEKKWHGVDESIVEYSDVWHVGENVYFIYMENLYVLNKNKIGQ